MKKYIIIAGVNGAGKSTLYQTIGSFKDMERVNTDEIVRSILPKFTMQSGIFTN